MGAASQVNAVTEGLPRSQSGHIALMAARTLCVATVNACLAMHRQPGIAVQQMCLRGLLRHHDANTPAQTTP